MQLDPGSTCLRDEDWLAGVVMSTAHRVRVRGRRERPALPEVEYGRSRVAASAVGAAVGRAAVDDLDHGLRLLPGDGDHTLRVPEVPGLAASTRARHPRTPDRFEVVTPLKKDVARLVVLGARARALAAAILRALGRRAAAVGAAGGLGAVEVERRRGAVGGPLAGDTEGTVEALTGLCRIGGGVGTDAEVGIGAGGGTVVSIVQLDLLSDAAGLGTKKRSSAFVVRRPYPTNYTEKCQLYMYKSDATPVALAFVMKTDLPGSG